MVTGNLWLVKFNGLILQPMASTRHKFPITGTPDFSTQLKFTLLRRDKGVI